jgi:hypothetical protein
MTGKLGRVARALARHRRDSDDVVTFSPASLLLVISETTTCPRTVFLTEDEVVSLPVSYLACQT